jgi:hypothetical protein
VHERRLTTKFSDRTPTVQHAGARQQAAREARPPAAEHFMVMRLAATPSWASRGRRLISVGQKKLIKQTLSSYHVKDMYHTLLVPVDESARILNDLAVSPPLKFRQFGAAQGMVSKLADMLYDALDQSPRSCRIV